MIVPDPAILVVGHYCHDTLVGKDGRENRAPGGSPTYISAVLEALGASFEVVSKVGEDFHYFDRLAKRPRVSTTAKTTHCLDDYSSGRRVETIDAVCEPIWPEEIAVSADVALACGIAGEVPPETIRELRRRSRILFADAQGLLRIRGPRGTVSHGRLENTPYAFLLDALDFLKANEFEAEGIDVERVRRKTNLIVTLQERGCVLYAADSELRVPGFPVPAVDPTGAGDCFSAGFAYGLTRGWDWERALRFGNYCGSLAVRQSGVPRLKRRDFDAFPDL